jgi:hypothetical protein
MDEFPWKVSGGTKAEWRTQRSEDLTGRTFGLWTVIRLEPNDPRRGACWWCKCSCPLGTEKVVPASALNRGRSKSCSCLQKARVTTHGLTPSGRHHELYSTWAGIRQRCNNPKHPHYKDYGGRGIKICARWDGPKGFPSFLSDMGERPRELSGQAFTLHRKDPNGNYQPSNCVWADRFAQAASGARRIPNLKP